ncbi:MAG: hypothetical protein LBT01_02945 [Spirochaetaceae bacterium]|nr:hypothetical protein [Spirochaetaceae bacterium]
MRCIRGTDAPLGTFSLAFGKKRTIFMQGGGSGCHCTFDTLGNGASGFSSVVEFAVKEIGF